MNGGTDGAQGNGRKQTKRVHVGLRRATTKEKGSIGNLLDQNEFVFGLSEDEFISIDEPLEDLDFDLS